MMRLLTTLIVCCAFAQGRPATRDIPLPEGIARASCIAEDGRGYSTPPSGRTLPVDCVGAPETVVRCDFDGAEPLDLMLAALCAAETVPATRARTVFVRAQRPTELTAEWVSFGGHPDGAVGVLARRTLTLQDSVALPVAPRDDRFITFRRPGASPVTMDADALAARDDWTLPGAAPGGELVARLSQAAVTAVKYRLVGPAVAETTPVRNVASFRAVPAGAYDLVPEYEGGLHGHRTSVTLRRGETTFVALPEGQVGGARIVADPSLCGAGAALAISRIRSDPDRGSSSSQSILTLPAERECVHTVAGLLPGEYEVSFRGQKGQLAAQRFEVTAQAWTPLSVAAGPVQLSGRVYMNGRPLPDVTIRFIPDAGPIAALVTETNAQGRYDLTLRAPGRFQVWFQRDGFTMLGNEREVTVGLGTNYVDWDLEGVTLTVTLKGWAHDVPVDISLMPLWISKPGKAGDNVRLLPTDSLPVVFSGIGYGRYAVQAREHSIPGARPGRLAGATVTLEEGQTETGIELVLTDGHGVIRVVDERGLPITEAAVKAGDNHLMQMSGGVFSRGDVAPASYVLASAPGFTPVVRLVPSESPFDIVLTRGIQVRLHFLAGDPPNVHGNLAWPGTDSPVPLQRFAVTRLPDAPGTFIVHNFPAASGVVYIGGPFDPPERHQPVAPDTNGVIRIK